MNTLKNIRNISNVSQSKPKTYDHTQIKCTQKFIAAIFLLIGKTRNNKDVFNGQIVKLWYIHTMELYSAIRKNELLICATI